MARLLGSARAGGHPDNCPGRTQSALAYLGVPPAHRGQGYVDELLAEGTRILAGQNVPRIPASTDLDNLPMAAAFIPAGWDNFERAITMTWA
ncbi:MAG: GNAT family N-acetyltransferase [Candidatus Dormiibacterota bacterium]